MDVPKKRKKTEHKDDENKKNNLIKNLNKENEELKKLINSYELPNQMTIRRTNRCEKNSSRLKKLKNDLYSINNISKSNKKIIASSYGHESSINLSNSNNNNLNNNQLNFGYTSCFTSAINKNENKNDNKSENKIDNKSINNKMINSTTIIVNNYLRKNKNNSKNNQKSYNTMSKPNLYKNPSFFNKRLANKIKYNETHYENNIDRYKKNVLSKLKKYNNKNYQSIQYKPIPNSRVQKKKLSTNAAKKKHIMSYKHFDIPNNNRANTERNITLNNLINMNSRSSNRLTQNRFNRKEELTLQNSLVSEKYMGRVNCSEEGRARSKEQSLRYNTHRAEILRTERNFDNNYLHSEKSDRTHTSKRIKIKINKKLIFNQKYNQSIKIPNNNNKNVINKKEIINKINNTKLPENKLDKISIKIRSQRNLITPTLSFMRDSDCGTNNSKKLKQLIKLDRPKNERRSYNDPTIKIFLTNNNSEKRTKINDNNNENIPNINNFNNCNYIYLLNNSCNTGNFNKGNKFSNKEKKNILVNV